VLGPPRGPSPSYSSPSRDRRTTRCGWSPRPLRLGSQASGIPVQTWWPLQSPRFRVDFKCGCSCSPPWLRHRPRQQFRPMEIQLGRPPARRKFTAFVVRETLDAFAADPAVCANVGPAANPKIPIATRQIVAFFTLVLPFAASIHLRARVLLRNVPRLGLFWFVPPRLLPKEKPRPLTCLRDFRLAEIP